LVVTPGCASAAHPCGLVARMVEGARIDRGVLDNTGCGVRGKVAVNCPQGRFES